MAHNVQAQIEREADKKGLEGERRQQYIGGAWQHVTQGEERREWWRSPDEHRILTELIGPIQEIRQPKGKHDSVYFKLNDKWYELPSVEYWRLVDEGLQLEREEKREQKRIAREARAEARTARQTERAQQAEQRRFDALARAEHHEVLSIIKRFGGIRRGKTAQGHEEERGEYNRLPSHVRARARVFGDQMRGLHADEAATAINQHMPWLRLETGHDLYDYFERITYLRNNRKAS